MRHEHIYFSFRDNLSPKTALRVAAYLSYFEGPTRCICIQWVKTYPREVRQTLDVILWKY